MREKQIEEMAKVMCGNDCEECAKESAEFYKQTLEEARNNNCLFKNCAKTLYEQGYRKLPKDSVVLSKEEYGSKLQDAYDNGVEFGKEWSSKETAEKILERGKYCMPSGLREWIIEQFGVEIKE